MNKVLQVAQHFPGPDVAVSCQHHLALGVLDLLRWYIETWDMDDLLEMLADVATKLYYKKCIRAGFFRPFWAPICRIATFRNHLHCEVRGTVTSLHFLRYLFWRFFLITSAIPSRTLRLGDGLMKRLKSCVASRVRFRSSFCQDAWNKLMAMVRFLAVKSHKLSPNQSSQQTTRSLSC